MTDWQNRSVVITHEIGLHARPSVKFTKTAKRFAAKVEISASPSGPWIDAKSIVKVMALRVPQNATLYLRAAGEGASEALENLINLVLRDFELGPADAEGA